MLQLDKPILFFDLETTGTNISYDRIVEISMLKYNTDGSTEQRTLRINPSIPIPPQSYEIHKISNDDIKDCPTFNDVAQDINTFIGDADLAGFNSINFDVPLLIEEFIRAGIQFSMDNRRNIDVMRIYKHFEKRDLSAAMQFYCNQELINAHSAEADVKATFAIFLAQNSKYEESLNGNMDTIASLMQLDNYIDTGKRMVKNNDGEIIFNFGKHKGKPVKEVLHIEPQYYDWIMKGDFALHTKQKLTEIKKSMLLKN